MSKFPSRAAAAEVKTEVEAENLLENEICYLLSDFIDRFCYLCLELERDLQRPPLNRSTTMKTTGEAEAQEQTRPGAGARAGAAASPARPSQWGRISRAFSTLPCDFGTKPKKQKKSFSLELSPLVINRALIVATKNESRITKLSQLRFFFLPYWSERQIELESST